MSYAAEKFGHAGLFTLGSLVGTWATTRVVTLTGAVPTVVGFVEAGGKLLTVDCISAVVNVQATVTAPILTFYRIVTPATALGTTTYSAGTMTIALARIIGDVIQFFPTTNNVLNPGELMSVVLTTAATAGSCFLSVEAHGENVSYSGSSGQAKPIATGAVGSIYTVTA